MSNMDELVKVNMPVRRGGPRRTIGYCCSLPLWRFHHVIVGRYLSHGETLPLCPTA